MTIETLRPNAAGSETSVDLQFPNSTFHWDKVDESSADEDSTYVENKSGAVGAFQRDLYALPDSGVGAGIINSVSIFVRQKHNGPSTFLFGISIKTNATVFDYDFSGAASSSWTTHEQALAVNPQTGIAWTWDEINALEAGVLLGGSTASPDWSRCTQIYIEVDYTDVAFTTADDPGVFGESAIVSATITDIGSETIIDHGHVYGTTTGPDITDSLTSLGAITEPITWDSLLSPLVPETQYFVRSYITTSLGTTYGNEISFTTTTGEMDVRFFIPSGVDITWGRKTTFSSFIRARFR